MEEIYGISLCFSIPKKALLLPLVWPGTEYTWALIWKKSLLICFESYQGIPYLFPYRQSRQEFEHFTNG